MNCCAKENATGLADEERMTGDDAAWALTCAFLILTMQTGFAMLECGCVSSKNVANIMVKNVVDVSLGGLSYWIFGYAVSFGHPSDWFMGYSGFCFSLSDTASHMGSEYSHYFFQFSFATTATTIVSGAVAERMRLHAYMLFSFFNTVVYCFPAGWAWNTGPLPWAPEGGFDRNSGGFLRRLRFFDFAGVCVVHVLGGTSALVAAIMLGPRKGRFVEPDLFHMSSPVTALTGMFMLWWAWLGFNCGSTFGVSGDLWKITALVSVTTLNGAIGGGFIGLVSSMVLHRGKVLLDFIINSVLGGLVGITGIAAVTNPVEALVIGAIGGLVAVGAPSVVERLGIDDPVGAVAVHLCAGSWGTLAVGLLGRENSQGTLRGAGGLLHTGDWYLLGVQTAGLCCIVGWSAAMTYLQLLVIDKCYGLRMSEEEEVLGADWVEHQVRSEPLASSLEQTLMSIDEQYWGDILQRLYAEVTSKKTQGVARGHRIFATDAGGFFGGEAEAARDLNAILEASHIPAAAAAAAVAARHEDSVSHRIEPIYARSRTGKRGAGLYSNLMRVFPHSKNNEQCRSSAAPRDFMLASMSPPPAFVTPPGFFTSRGEDDHDHESRQRRL